MLRPFLLGMLGILVCGSLHGIVSSQALHSMQLSHSPNSSSNMPHKMEDDFVPDTLTSEDDDAEEEPAEKSSQGNIRTASEVESLRSSSGSSKHSKQEMADRIANGERGVLKDAGPPLDVTAMTSTSVDSTPVTKVANPQRRLPLETSRSLATSNSANNYKETTPMREEETLRVTTQKLVKWLRNRLRKRLEEVAALEEEYDVEKKLLTNLNAAIETETSERQAEIKMKLETQKELKDVRRHFSEPDRELHEIHEEISHLVDQLTRLKKIYNDLAITRKKMEDRLVSAGVTHWLNKRGKEHMPATAVGVLSKSAQILDPVSRGLEEVVKLDERFSSSVESVMPISQRSLVSKIMRDLALLLPIIPVIMLLWRISQISQRVSVLHLVMYISTIFAIESGLIFALSLCTGAEAINGVQKSYELFVVTGVFVDVLLFSVMIITQMLVMALRMSKSEIMQSLLSLAVGYHFFHTVFQPVVVSQSPTTTTAAHLMYTINFILIAFEKKATLKVGTRLDKHLNGFLLAMERWFCETLQAMKDLFADTLPDMSDDGSTSSQETGLSSHNALLREVDPVEDASHRKEVDVEDIAKALNASRGYARWTAGRTGHYAGQGKPAPAFRGTRWYQTNPQLSLLQSGSRRRVRQENMCSETDSPHLFRPRKE